MTATPEPHWNTVPVSGGVTAYLEHGAGETAVVLLHNGLFGQNLICSNAACWEHNLAALGEGIRPVAIDLLGHGGTAPPDAPDAYSYAGVVAHACAAIGALGIRRAHLVGHDQGGMVAVRLAIEDPGLVASCTVVNSPSVAPGGDAVPNLTLTRSVEPLFSRESQGWVLARQSFAPHHIETGRFLATASAMVEAAGAERDGVAANRAGGRAGSFPLTADPHHRATGGRDGRRHRRPA